MMTIRKLIVVLSIGLLSSHAFAAWTLRANQSGNTVKQNGSSGTSISCCTSSTRTGTLTTGDLELATVMIGDTVNDPVTGFQDGAGNNFTVLSSITFNTDYGNGELACLIVPSGASQTITATVSFSAAAVLGIWVDEFNPNGQSITGCTSGTNVAESAGTSAPTNTGPGFLISTPPSITVSSGELGYSSGVCDSGYGTSPTMNSPWTLGGALPVSGANDFQAGGYVLSTTAGSLFGSYNDVAGTDPYATIVAAFSLGSGASGGGGVGGKAGIGGKAGVGL
jgi:hypothetical protein